MTLRTKLAFRYSVLIGVCLLLLGGLAYHEFVTEPWQRRLYKIPEPPETWFTEYAEVFFYGMIPLVLTAGWWFMRKTLAPIDDLARQVECVHADNLHQPLPRSGNGDEVDQLTDAFNSLATRLDQSFQQIRQFTLHASHELKTPLTVMEMQLQAMLRDAQSLSPEQRDWLECQFDEVQRLGKIVDALTLLTRADTGLVPLERKPVRLSELMRESLEDAQTLAEPGAIRVTLAECADPVVGGDRDRIRQLLLNLVDNAVKYNRPGGSLTMALRHVGDAAEIEVTNTGEGIPPELLARVFDRFVRGDEARNRAIEGCGLGLTIGKWIVQAHGGTIRISSTPGLLTTATVRLPLAPPAGAESFLSVRCGLPV